MEQLGINGTYLLIQTINFVVLLIILNKVLYKPVMDMLTKRRKKIEEGLSLTESLSKEKEKLEEQKQKVLADAGKEAKTIIEEAKKQAKRLEEEIIADAHKKAALALVKGKQELVSERKSLEAKITRNIIDMSLSISEKVIGDFLDAKTQDKLLKKKISQFTAKKNLS